MPRSADTLAPPFTLAGVDEVGRGPLAGPVVAAAVVLDPHRPVDGIDDSKRLGERDRERLDTAIRARARAWCVASASVAEIDELNILHASLLAMRRAVDGLVRADAGGASPAVRDAPAGGDAGDSPGARPGGATGFADPFESRPGGPAARPALVLVDGNRCPPLPCPAAAIVGGDARVRAIAAASIVAKVARDALMRRWHERYPEFGFAAHKGYATKQHREALERLGATPLHRRSFAPVQAALRDPEAIRSTDEPSSPSEP